MLKRELVILAVILFAFSGCVSGTRHGSEVAGEVAGKPSVTGKPKSENITLDLPAAPLGNVASYAFNASLSPAAHETGFVGHVKFDFRYPFEATLFRRDNQSYSRVSLLYGIAPSGSTNAPPAGTTRPYLSGFDWGRIDQPLWIGIAASGSFVLAFGYRSVEAVELTLTSSNFTLQAWRAYDQPPGYFFASSDDAPSQPGEFSANVADLVHPAKFSGSTRLNVSGAATIFWGGGPGPGGTFRISLMGPTSKTWTVSTPAPSSPLVYEAEIHSVTIPPGDWTLSYEAVWHHGFMLLSALTVPEGPPLAFVDELCKPRVPCHTAPV